MQEDCYWYLDESSEPRIVAKCVECNKKDNLGWFWNGKKIGYGDYDLNCSICNKVIYKKDEKEQKD